MNIKDQKGFIALFPVLLIAAAFVITVTIAKTGGYAGFAGTENSVLSESTDEDKPEDRSGSSKTPEAQKTEKPEDSSDSVTPEVRSTEKPSKNTERRLRTPKPSETPRAFRTPKPSETPELELENETEDETETEIETEVKDGSFTAKIKIQQNGRSFQFEQEGSTVEVQGNFPVSVDDETNVLTITTPSGPHDVTVLPDKAVENMLDTGLVSEVDKDQTGRNDVRIVADANGNPVYEVRGVKVEKLFGLFNISLDRNVHVSLKDGQMINLDQSFISRILDLVSI
jgi:hypothetical protein